MMMADKQTGKQHSDRQTDTHTQDGQTLFLYHYEVGDAYEPKWQQGDRQTNRHARNANTKILPMPCVFQSPRGICGVQCARGWFQTPAHPRLSLCDPGHTRERRGHNSVWRRPLLCQTPAYPRLSLFHPGHTRERDGDKIPSSAPLLLPC